MARKRKRLTRSRSKKMFRKTGSKVHPKNNRPPVMRGGIRA